MKKIKHERITEERERKRERERERGGGGMKESVPPEFTYIHTVLTIFVYLLVNFEHEAGHWDKKVPRFL
jgi:hypothetical protein